MPTVRRVSIGAASLWVLSLLSATGCAAANMRVGEYKCSQLTEYFYGKPPNERVSQFVASDLEKQYAIYICGNQYLEPPATYLAEPFAREGGRIVGFLKAKLMAAHGDLTIRDILLVFSEMSRRKSYNVAGDTDLMKVITEGVDRVKDPFWKKTSEQSLDEIRQQASAAAQ